MANIVWYYRPEQIETEENIQMHQQELFASRHIDTIPVDCSVEIVYVITLNEYCRYSF